MLRYSGPSLKGWLKGDSLKRARHHKEQKFLAASTGTVNACRSFSPHQRTPL